MPSRRTCPSARRATSMRSMTDSCPRTAFPTSLLMRSDQLLIGSLVAIDSGFKGYVGEGSREDTAERPRNQDYVSRDFRAFGSRVAAAALGRASFAPDRARSESMTLTNRGSLGVLDLQPMVERDWQGRSRTRGSSAPRRRMHDNASFRGSACFLRLMIEVGRKKGSVRSHVNSLSLYEEPPAWGSVHCILFCHGREFSRRELS